MRDLIPLIVGLVVAAVVFAAMLLNVWSLIHAGPEVRDHWLWLGGLTFWIVPAAAGFLAGWVVYRQMNLTWWSTPSSRSK